MQLLIGERDAARRRVDELQLENATLVTQSEGRMEVIRTMMLQAEGSSSQGVSLARDNAQLQAHCKTLSANLETNAQVIEKLIELNSELMDSLNSTTAAARRHEQPAAADAAPETGSSSGSSAVAGTSLQRDRERGAGSVASISGGGGERASSDPSRTNAPAAAASSSSLAPVVQQQLPSAPPPPPSLSAAFEAFLTDSPSSERRGAKAEALAIPTAAGLTSAAASGGRWGIGGMFKPNGS